MKATTRFWLPAAVALLLCALERFLVGCIA